MSVLGSFTLRSLGRNRARTVVSVLGVMLSTALLMAVFTTVTSLDAMLLDRTVEHEGSWQVFDVRAEEGYAEKLQASPNVSCAMASGELGSALVEGGERFGWVIVGVRTMPRAVVGTDEDVRALSVMPGVIQGREPEAPGEVMLPEEYRGAELSPGDGEVPRASSDGPLSLGSTITLPLGRRVSADGHTLYSIVDYYEHPDGPTNDGESSQGERLEDVAVREFEVVGFYEDQYYARNDFSASPEGPCALVWSGEEGALNDSVWVATTGLALREDVKALAEPIFGVEDYYLHSNLLNYQGMTGSGPMWSSLWGLAAVLAAAIAIAAASLIYNSFAISVAERTRQFGLLSSLGATRAQLGRSVLAEALVLGAMGIPLGIAAGVGGVSATLSVTGEAFGYLLDRDVAGPTGIPVSVSPWVVLFVAALSLLVVVVSAAVPAIRATRVPAADALRQAQDVGLGRGEALRRARGAGLRDASRGHSPLERAMGFPALLARRNLTRAGSRGRVVVASLAVSVALLVTSGSIRMLLAPLVSVTASGYGVGGDADIVVSLSLEAEPHAEGAGSDLGRLSADLERRLGELDEVGGTFSLIQGEADLTMPAGMVSTRGEGLEELLVSEAGGAGIAPDGSFVGRSHVYYLDDDAWLELAGGGADLGRVGPDRVPALLVNIVMSRTERGGYTTAIPYERAGAVTAWHISEVEGYWPGTLCLGQDGGIEAEYWPTTDEWGSEDVLHVPIDQASDGSTSVEVVGLLASAPRELSDEAALWEFPVVILPRSALGATPALWNCYRAVIGIELADGASPIDAEDAIWDAYNALEDPAYILDCSLTVANVAQEGIMMRAVYDLINLFVLLFTLITMLVAAANVFNTLSSNVILRAREFAMLRSCGMDRRTMAKMLLCECLSYAVRGLALGLALAGAIAAAMWVSLREGFWGMTYPQVPWAWIGAAVLAVVCVLGASVVYALHRGRALNVVETLRQQ